MDNFQRAADIIKKSQHMIALTGAGISVESGIPDFRSSGGLWEKYDPSIYATIDTFRRNPEMVWEMLFDMDNIVRDARPNKGHLALARLEEMGLLKYIITQNVDNLHQEAGNKNVIEYHGNSSKLECLKCGVKYDNAEKMAGKKEIPRCDSCNEILKPTVIFFGEMIPYDALHQSSELASQADVVLVVGTSAIVYPAAGIPMEAKQNNAVIIEVNMEPSALTNYITDIFIQGSAGENLDKIIALLEN